MKSFCCKLVFGVQLLSMLFVNPCPAVSELSLSIQRKERGAWSWLGLACVDVVVLFQTTYHHPPHPRFSKEWKCPMVFWKVCMLFPALFFPSPASFPKHITALACCFALRWFASSLHQQSWSVFGLIGTGKSLTVWGEWIDVFYFDNYNVHIFNILIFSQFFSVQN